MFVNRLFYLFLLLALPFIGKAQHFEFNLSTFDFMDASQTPEKGKQFEVKYTHLVDPSNTGTDAVKVIFNGLDANDVLTEPEKATGKAVTAFAQPTLNVKFDIPFGQEKQYFLIKGKRTKGADNIEFAFHVVFYTRVGGKVLVEENFDIQGSMYEFELIKHNENGYYYGFMKSTSDIRKNYTFKLLKMDSQSLEIEIKKGLEKFKNLDTSITDDLTKKADYLASTYFQKAVINEITVVDRRPVAGSISIEKSISKMYESKFYSLPSLMKIQELQRKKEYRKLAGGDTTNLINRIKRKNNKIGKINNTELNIENVQIQFEGGYIENIIVEAIDKDKKKYKFQNTLPIGFTSKRNHEFAKYIWLHDHNTQMHIRLGQILDYTPNLRVNTRDYSPADTVVVSKDLPIVNTKLPKLATSKILQARIFSDFVGLNKENPNGLIQTEIGKRIVINSRRLVQNWLPRSVNFGFFEYIEPSLTISKFDENNYNLPVVHKEDIVSKSISNYVSTLDVFRYENISLGVDFNLGLLDIQTLKSTIYFNVGYRLGKTSLVDTIKQYDNTSNKFVNTGVVNQFTVNTARVYPEILWKIKPDSTYGVQASYRYNRYYIPNPNVFQVADSKSFKESYAKHFHSIELCAFYSPNPNSELFLRYRLHIQRNEENLNFQQFQIGYSFYPFTRKIKEK